jgi:cell division protein FtsN
VTVEQRDKEQSDSGTERHGNRETVEQRDRRTDRQRNRDTVEQRDSGTERQSNIETLEQRDRKQRKSFQNKQTSLTANSAI